MPLRTRMSSQRGFTLIETMAASLVLVVGLLGAFILVNVATGTTMRNRAREGALALTREVLESARSLSYGDLTPNEIVPKLKALPGLADSQAAASGYTVKRRGTVYTIDATVCSYDDPVDSTGPHDTGNYCSDTPGSTGSGTLDFGGATGDGSVQLGGGTPDDYKRVVVTLSWKQGSTTRTMTQRTLVQNPGNADGPAISMFSTPSTTIITSDANVPFSVTSSRSPALINWSVDGTVQGSVQNPGASWSFNWPISTLVDGDYIVSAQAFDTSGVSGASRSLTVKLNRNAPVAPTGVAAGRNGSVVDVEWLVNNERDISGYYVYRVDAGGNTQVCPASGTTPLNATSCQDTSPPATGTLTYKVAAVDRNTAGAFRAGALSAAATAPAGNTAPNAPTNLLASTSGGNTILRWTAPAVADPDPGDSIGFYRIYRDGKAYSDRYDRSSTPDYTDRSPGSSTHTYYVTAVDTHLAESTLLGPVTK
jgi:prepilin-type N-terminal cleavage/methylation domain-containing protein